jgi:hypothetical protein
MLNQPVAVMSKIREHRPELTTLMVQIMDKHELLWYQEPTKKFFTVIGVTLEGHEAIRIGIRAYIAKMEERKNRADAIEKLTLQKLSFEQFSAKFWIIVILFNVVLTGLVSYIVAMLVK